MKGLSESEKIDCLIDFFEWDDTSECRYHALLILRKARGEQYPTWDDFRKGRER